MQFQEQYLDKPKQPAELLNSSLQKSYIKIDLKTIEIVKNSLSYIEDRTYKLFIQENSTYLNFIWSHIVKDNKHFQNYIIPKMGKRFNSVYQDLLNNNIKIEEKQPILPLDVYVDQKNNKFTTLKEYSNQTLKKADQINQNSVKIKETQKIVQGKAGYQMLYLNEQKRKQYEQKIKKINEQRQQIHKKIIDQQKKQEQDIIRRQNEMREQIKKIKQQKRQQSIKKQQQLHENREKQKQLRQKRNSQYIRLKKVIGKKPPLFQRLENHYNKRYVEFEVQQRQRLLQQRKFLFEHIDNMKLQEHQKFYQKLKYEKEIQRRQRLMKQDQQQRQRIKFHSSFDQKRQPDLKQQQKLQAKQKIQKMNQYKQLVLQKYKPKIDEEKRKQLLNLIEQMNLSRKKVKKRQLQNGQIVYQQIQLSDPRIKGIQYLEQVKQITSKMKGIGKRKNSLDLNPKVQKKIPNYLQEMRNKEKPKKFVRILTHNMSYEQKVKRVELQTEKLNQLAKQKEMKLKFGKFKTSQQILGCKEQIDKHYLEIVRMKLDLAREGKDNNIQ